MISVVIPLYNKEHQIQKTLQSVLAQTYTDFEIIIVNDGSTDRSVERALEINDPRIRLISQPNAGVSAARNRGIREANGKYVALLDADDRWKPDYLQAIVNLVSSHPECKVFATRYEFCDEFGNIRPSIIRELPIAASTSGVLENYFHIASVSDAPLCSSAVASERKAILEIGGFPEGITSGEDLLTWARLAARHAIAFCNRPMAVYYTPTTGPTGKVPADLQSTNDAVGRNLIALSQQFPKAGIGEYISFWYKMRSVINLGRRNRLAAFRCALKAARFKPTNHKAWMLVVLSLMPGFIIKKAIGR